MHNTIQYMHTHTQQHRRNIQAQTHMHINLVNVGLFWLTPIRCTSVDTDVGVRCTVQWEELVSIKLAKWPNFNVQCQFSHYTVSHCVSAVNTVKLPMNFVTAVGYDISPCHIIPSPFLFISWNIHPPELECPRKASSQAGSCRFIGISECLPFNGVNYGQHNCCSIQLDPLKKWLHPSHVAFAVGIKER